MTHLTLDSLTLTYFAILHRGAPWAYAWLASEAKKPPKPGSEGKGDPLEKLTTWYPADTVPPALNDRGPHGARHLYYGVHPTTACGNQHQRAKLGERDIGAVNCVFAEYDVKDYGSKQAILGHISTLPLRPSALIDSGGGVHASWLFEEPFILTTDEERALANWVQKAWVDLAKSDDAAKDLARVLRIPGTKNYKAAYGPDFPTAHFIEANFERRYTFEQIAALVPPVPVAKAKAARKPVDVASDIQDETGADFDTIADAARHLKRLSAERRDDYVSWIEVGMALRELGAIGFCLWEKWSKLSPKHQPGECAEKWRTFTPGTGITLASLGYWAREDDPDGAPAVPEEAQRELTDLRQRVTWEQKILHCKGLKPTEKGVLVGLYDIIAAHRHLGGNDGRIPLDYDYAAKALSTSKTTVGKVVDIGEKVGLWRKDPETVASDDGYEIKRMRLELQPAYDAPPKHADLDRPKHGGARPGAGRKPKCTECPPGTVHRMVTKRNVSYYCPVHGLIKEEALPDLIDDYVPDGIQDETEEETVVTSVSSFAMQPEADTGIQEETGSVEEQRTLVPLADNKHSGQPEAPIIGPTAIGDALVNLGYIENRLKAGDLSAIKTHCLLAGADYRAVIAAAQAPPAGGTS